MNDFSKELFADRVVVRLNDLTKEQQNCVKNAIIEEMDNYLIYTPEEAAEIIQDPLLILERFLKMKTFEGLSKNTIALYRFNITRFVSHTIKRVIDITPEDVKEYLNFKVNNGGTLVYVNNIRSSLSSFFSWMYVEEYINRNPMDRVKSFKCERELQPAFTEIEIDAIRRAAASNPREIALVDFLLSTGCRVSEVCSANISDINFSNKKLRVVGKGNKSRTVYLTDVAVCTLKAYIRQRDDNNEALFINGRAPHGRMSPAGIQGLLNKIGKRASVSNVHPHRFRHTCCTRLLCRGMDLQNVSRILGHSNVNTTMWYNNTSDDHIDSQFRLYSY